MKTSANTNQEINRRQFLGSTATAAIGVSIVSPQLAFGAEANGKINLGLIGCGGRGGWIANLFAQNGNYNLVAVADYFQDRVDVVGKKYNVPEGRRFSGLSGYKRLLEQKLDAVAIETPPYFHPEHAAAAVDAGKHVYLAKPVAVDVPGCHAVEASGKRATDKKLCFQVDFQTRATPSYQEAVKRVHDGQIGKIVSVDASYHCGSTFGGMDAALRKDPQNPEARLRAWGLDRVLSGDVITEQNIHALDVASWFLNAEPIKAYGTGGQSRGFLGTCWDHFAVVFYFPNNVIVSFNSKQVGAGYDDILCRVFGTEGTADTHYGGDIWVRSKDDLYNGGKTGNIFTDGVQRNIATFYDSITKADHTNPSVAPSVRSNLTTILGRTACYKNGEVTWAEVMRANEKFKLDLKGLKA